MSFKTCSPDGWHRPGGILKDFFSPVIHSKVFSLFKGSALLEYPQEYLDRLQDEVANHHYDNWDKIYQSFGKKKPEYDPWLQKYDGLLKASKDDPIIDLGCGYGNDTLYLHERGYKVISCDLSLEALKRLDHFIDKPVIRHFDMLAGLPFDNCSARVIIADLSIHYFRWEETERIVEEIGRVLDKGGYCLCRVNSVKNMECEAGNGVKIEENYYDFGSRKKRYFDKNCLERLFRTWDICHIGEYCLERFGSAKAVWDMAVRKAV